MTTSPPRPGSAEPSTTTGRPPRQARAVATRATIVAAAAAEFAERGYREASLSRILLRSGATKGALYFHFRSKDTMARAVVVVMEQRFPEIVASFEARGHDPLTTAVHLAVGLADVVADDPYVRGGMRIAAEGTLEQQQSAGVHVFWEQVFVDLFTRARAEGSLREDVDPTVLARTIVAMGHGHRVVSGPTTDFADLRERAESSWTFLLARIADQAWLARWDEGGGVATVPSGVPDDAGGRVP